MKKFFFAAFAVFALSFAACDKEGGNDTPSGQESSQSDFVGKWVDNYDDEYEFKADGTVIWTSGENTENHKWSFADGVLKFDLEEEGKMEAVVFKFAAGKNVLGIGTEDDYNGLKSCFYSVLRKKGVTVKTANPSDGRWDAPHSGIKPEVLNSEENDYTACIIVKGNTWDLYLPMWGFHVNANYAINDGIVTFSNTKSWQGIYRHEGSYGWQASGPPYDIEDWDYTKPNMNPETFAIRSPWVTEEGDPMKNMRAVENMAFYVTDDGKEAFGVFAGLAAWFYKR